MPNYDFRCQGCGGEFERRVPLSEFELVQTHDCFGDGTTMGTAKRLLTSCNFVLVGDDWPGKNIKISGQMEQKNKVLDRKQFERKMDSPSMGLVPNFNGERTNNWAEASRMASEAGKDATSYAPLVAKETP